MTPKDLSTLLFDTTEDDMPNGVRLEDDSRPGKTCKNLIIGEMKVAILHYSTMQGKPNWLTMWEMRDREEAIATLISRIASVTRQRIADTTADANAILDGLV